jgi:hypothetical protein
MGPGGGAVAEVVAAPILLREWSGLIAAARFGQQIQDFKI